MRRKAGSDRSYDFECTDVSFGYRFLRVLKKFDIVPVDYYVDIPGNCMTVKFFSTKKQRSQIEYIFRRLIGLDRTEYLMDLDKYQNRCERYRDERYIIF